MLSSGALCLQRFRWKFKGECECEADLMLCQKFYFVFRIHLKVVTLIWCTVSEAVNNLCKVVYFLTRFINLLTCYLQLVDDNNR